MSSHDDTSPGVRIGNVTGGIHNSLFAGRDISDTTITVGEKTMRADDTPTQADLAQLMADISKELTDVMADREQLSAVSAAAPYAVQGATECVNAASKQLAGEISPAEATAVQRNLTDAATLVGTVVDTTDPDANTGEGLGAKIKSVAQKLGPLLEKLAVAAVWVSKLWLSIPGG